MRAAQRVLIVVLVLLTAILTMARASHSQVAQPPKIAYFDLTPNSTGVTTAASGVSNTYVHAGSNYQTPQSSDVSSDAGVSVVRGISSIINGYFVYQIDSMAVASASASNSDLATVSPWYKVSAINTAAAWAVAKKNYIFGDSGVSLAGVSRQQVPIYPGWTEFMQHGIDIGATPWGLYKARMVYR